MTAMHTRQLQQYTRPTDNNYTKDNLKLATKYTRQIIILHVQKVKTPNTKNFSFFVKSQLSEGETEVNSRDYDVLAAAAAVRPVTSFDGLILKRRSRQINLNDYRGGNKNSTSLQKGTRTLKICIAAAWRNWSLTYINPLTPKDPHSGHTAPLTSKRCILYIYSTNRGTEYFKHGIYSPFFLSSKCSLFHNSNIFCSCLFIFYIQDVLKFKKIIPAPKG